MLDATFIRDAARHLTAARQIRRDLPKLKAQVAKYHHISPMDRQREIDRMRERHSLHVAFARRANEAARLYTQGDNHLRAANALRAADQPILADMMRQRAESLFDRALNLPPPNL